MTTETEGKGGERDGCTERRRVSVALVAVGELRSGGEVGLAVGAVPAREWPRGPPPPGCMTSTCEPETETGT